VCFATAPASQGFGFGAILVLAGRAARLEAVRQKSPHRRGVSVDPTIQVLITLATGLLISIVTSVVTVRLSLRQFYSQRWWEQKWGQYSKVLEALYHIRHYNDRLRASVEAGKDLSASRKTALVAKSRESSDEIDRVTTIGAFTMSDGALGSLTHLRRQLKGLDIRTMSSLEFLDQYVAFLDQCILEVVASAKKDLPGT